MKMRDTWNDYTSARQALFGGSFGCGVALLATGVTLDFTTNWGNESFLINVLSSFSSFLVGVPVALVALSTITSEREEKAQLDKVRKLSNAAWVAFKTDAEDGFANPETQIAFYGNASNLIILFREIMDDLFRVSLQGRKNLTDAEYPGFQQDTLQKVRMLGGLISNVDTAIPHSQRLQTKWAGVTSRWAVLDNYVRLQRLEYDLPWMPAKADAGLKNALGTVTCPLTDFSDIHYPRGLSGHSKSMGDVPGRLAELLALPQEELISQLRGPGGFFVVFKTDELASQYLELTSVANWFLSSFSEDVVAAGRNGWMNL